MTIVWYIIFAIAILVVCCVVFGFIAAYKLYHPYRKPQKSSDDGHDLQKLRIPSSQGVELDCALLSAEGASHLVLITHEIGSFKESKLKLARWLVSQGYCVLLFDLRNHGSSSRDRALWSMGGRFTDDIESVIKFSRYQLPEIKTLTLYSYSFSTFSALSILNRELEQPDNIVLDSGPRLILKYLFGDFLDEFGRVVGLVPKFLKNPALYIFYRTSFQFFGYKMLSATCWPPDLSKLKGRVLFISNDKDPIFSEEELLSVAGQVSNKEIWVCPDSTHLQAYRSSPKKYQQVLLNFLQQRDIET